MKPTEKLLYFPSEAAVTEQEIDRYIKEISNNLVCSSKIKERFLKEFRSDVNEYIQINRVQQFDDVIKHFGTPHKIAEEFIIPDNFKFIQKAINLKKTIIIFSSIVLFSFIVYLVFSYIDGHKSTNGSHIVEIVDGTDVSVEGDF
ncbi:MAG: hypothetical protein IKK09_05085 [Clostridia bacterium]|nr:hypothetical protein [Clostridia bacterium]